MSSTPAVEQQTVGAVSRRTGVTVRTLHHYDRVGLLVPSDRSPAGYRQYSEADLDRLQRVLFYRELGFSLEAIATLLDTDTDPVSHLERQRDLLAERIARLQLAVAAVNKELEAHTMGVQLGPEERFALFGDGFDDSYAAEAEQRWGDTEAWKQSQQRTASHTKQDWTQIKQQSTAIEQGFVVAQASGAPPESETAMDLAEQHRQHIIRWFYDCPPAMHRGLGAMYQADERFAGYYEQLAPGLAAYVGAAVEANAARQG